MKYIICFVLIFLSSLLSAELFFTSEMINSHLKNYTEEEIRLIKKDLDVVRSVCVQDEDNPKKTSTRFYLASAGGPGAHKTTILEKFVSQHPEYQSGIYLDPDPRTLKFMVHTYYARSLNSLTISETKDYSQVIKNAYEKWRGASNYIVLSLLEECFAENRSVIFGTTSTGGHNPKFFEKLKENNYQIVLVLCSAPDETRYDAINYRNTVVRFYQSSVEDAVVKGVLFSQKMKTYFDLADRMYLYWSEGLFSTERLAGIWQNGHLQVHDKEAMQCFIDKYEVDRVILAEAGTIIPSFESFLKSKNM